MLKLSPCRHADATVHNCDISFSINMSNISQTNQPGQAPGWDQVHAQLGEFKSAVQQMGTEQQRYYTGKQAIAALYGGQEPTPGYFDGVQYLPMNANFYMPPGAGLPYMDPYGIMNPGALPPVMPVAPVKKPVSKKEKARFCC